MAQPDFDLGLRESEFLPVERGTPPDGGAGVSGFCVFVGLVFLGVGAYLALLCRNSGQPQSALVMLLLTWTVGIALIVWQGPLAFLPLLIGTPRGSISGDPVRSGDAFLFRYTQPQRKPLIQEVTCSLVLREFVDTEGSEGQIYKSLHSSHLIESHTSGPQEPAPGNLFQVSARFRIPADGGARLITRPDSQRVWVMKVRVRLRDGRDLWEEFFLPSPSASIAPQPPPAAERYRVVIKRYRSLVPLNAVPEALLDIAPHLHEIPHFPAVVREGANRPEAERACRRLEADGAVVQLWHGDQRVERQSTHRLPVPHDGPAPTECALPIPAAGEALAAGEHLIELRSGGSSSDR